MKVALFIPCYVDQFFPQVGRATLSVLEKLGCSVVYPDGQTCCGQPLANSGYASATGDISANFRSLFGDFEHVVCPSGSCILHAREHVAPADVNQRLHRALTEFTEFVAPRLADRQLSSFAGRVGVHHSCHGLRGLRLGTSSELVAAPRSLVHDVLGMIPGLELVRLYRPDECCGFGGTFAVKEAAISVRMGEDRLEDHLTHGADVVASADMSCLMHLQGIAKRQERKVRFAHVAEILDEVLA